jgi:hypothetical protein
MTSTIQEAVPGVLKTLWNLENELRSAAQNGVILRGEEARNHLQQARHHLDELLGIANGSTTEKPSGATADLPPESSISSNDNKF